MLTQQEKDFLRYWEDNRLNKKKFLRQFSIGLPLGVLIAVAIFINVLSGWYKKADMEVRSNSSLILVIIIGLLLTVVFITIFSSRLKWEQNEQRYLELKKKSEKDSSDHASVTENK
jgi:Na+-driven multidrug efflux pump